MTRGRSSKKHQFWRVKSKVIRGEPVQTTHDCRLLYQSTIWNIYAKEINFENWACKPKHSKANKIAERFMSVIFKIETPTGRSGKNLGNKDESKECHKMQTFANTANASDKTNRA